jgi:tetratricopeptide (TPR) repeat protein
MKLTDFIPNSEQLKLIQGIEGYLKRRKRTEHFSLVISAAVIILQFILTALEKRSVESLLQSIINFHDFILFAWGNKTEVDFRNPAYWPDYVMAPLFILMLVLIVYFSLKRTQFLFKYSAEPFQYTFRIEPFIFADNTGKPADPAICDDRFRNLLHHDLMERLNNRIKRLSLLNTEKLCDTDKKKLCSHFHISGTYTIRELKKGKCVVHIWPRIQIGSSDRPETLASPVKYNLNGLEMNCEPAEFQKKFAAFFDADKYNQLIERIYSNIATEIYAQIKTDLKEKIGLFPTKYLRAAALFHEAEDFARSNTIDAYDQAIELYRESLGYLNITLRCTITAILIRLPVLWRLGVNFGHTMAEAMTGYAKCLIYRRQISSLSGRRLNPLFEVYFRLDEIVVGLMRLHNRIFPKEWRLILPASNQKYYELDEGKRKKNRLNLSMGYLTFPADSLARRALCRPGQSLFEKQRRLMFEANVIAALTFNYLNAFQKAKNALKDAKAVAPDLSQQNALFLLASGEIEPQIGNARSILLLAAECSTDFQMAQYLLAYYSEMNFRMQNELVTGRVEGVLLEYDKLLEINPGNIAALAAQGYLAWLVNDPGKARGKYEDGCAIKAIVRETFIGQLNYGIARIEAETGAFNDGCEKFTEAVSAYPEVAAFSHYGRTLQTAYYDYIDSAMLGRYESYKNTVDGKIGGLEKVGNRWRDADNNEFSDITIRTVRSYVYNDYGNACLNYYHRSGDPVRLNEAIKYYEEAVSMNPQNMISLYNLHNAYSWRAIENGNEKDNESAVECLKTATEKGFAWPVSLIAYAQLRLKMMSEKINKIFGQIEIEDHEIEETREKMKNGPGDEKSPGRKENIGSSPEGINTGSEKPGRNTYGSDLRERDLPGKRPEIFGLEEKSQKHKEKIGILDNEINELLKKRYAEIVAEENNIVKNSKFAWIFQNFLDKRERGEKYGEDDLLNQQIRIDRLDEFDIDVLRSWAEILSKNYFDDNDRQAARLLCGHIQEKYLPDDFDVNLILYYMHDFHRRYDGLIIKYNLIDTPGGAQTISEDNAAPDETIGTSLRETLNHWLSQDPAKFTALRWTEGFFTEDETIKFIKEALDKHTESAAHNNLLGYFLNKKQDYAGSLEYFRRACGKNPDIPHYHANLGNAYYVLKQWDDAVAAYQEALRIGPGNAAYRNTLGNICYDSGKYPEAIEHYKKTIGLSPEIAVYHANLGLAYYALKQWDDAVAAYQEALRIEPDNAAYRNTLGNICYESGKYSEASEHYKKAIELSPEAAVYHANLGLAYYALKQWDDAVTAYQEALKIEPGNAAYRNTLGNICYDSGKYSEASEHYKKAIELSPETAVYHDNLALAEKRIAL